MTNAAAQTGIFGDWNFPQPHPTQDTDLLQQLPFLPGLKELLMLRQVHALEHGTVWVLSETARSSLSHSHPYTVDNEALGGVSTEQGFYLYGEVNPTHLRRAVQTALRRFRGGEWDLAIHPRCGTNFSVAVLLTTGMVMGTHLFFPKILLAQVLGLGIAATTAAHIAPDVGKLAQKYLTTSVPFNLELDEILDATDLWGRPTLFVRVRWK